MNYNFHTHTYRCHHAEGMPEEYIKRAIESGIEHMGFSEHIPHVFSDGHESHYRMHVADVEDYYREICALREKYKNQIKISVGFEMEYYPMYFEKMYENAIKWGAEYLILGQHFINQTPDNYEGTYVVNDGNTDLKEYVRCVTAAMQKGVFTYVAHPDVFNFCGSDDEYCELMRKICIKSLELGVPLEINCLGIKRNRFYPNELFWKVAGEEKSPVTIGFDAHNTYGAYDDSSLEKAKAIVKKYNLNYIGKPEMIYLQ